MSKLLLALALLLCLSAPLLAADITTFSDQDLVLQKYNARCQNQNRNIVSYQNDTIVHAELPDSAQQGEYELIASYTAEPRSLTYSSVHFEGDRFVKSNIIVRLLESEADHVRKGDDGATAISPKNYKFNYQGTQQLRDRQVVVFRIKPRRKSPGLFKGSIFLDPSTGAMLRMEGAFVKSPSFFVRDIHFVQDFDDVQGVTLPSELSTWARVRMLGRTVVKIVHRSYTLHLKPENAQVPATGIQIAAAN